MVLGSLHNLILVGLRGSGKTTLGRALAQTLQRPFVDLDDALAQAAGCSADTLLAEQGEAAFRDVERGVLARAAELSGHVIATGGGAVLHPVELAALASTGCVVYLKISLPELLARAEGRPRPRLRAGSLKDEFIALAAARNPSYEEVAQITVSSPDVISILEALDTWPQRPPE